MTDLEEWNRRSLEERAERLRGETARKILEKRFPGKAFEAWIESRLRGTLDWKGYVFHGQYQIFDSLHDSLGYAPPSLNADVEDLLMDLLAVGVIEPKRYAPSHSRAAFSCFGTGRTKRPSLGNAIDWEYEVIKPYRKEE